MHRFEALDQQGILALVVQPVDVLEDVDDNSAYEIGPGIELLVYNKTVRNPKINLL